MTDEHAIQLVNFYFVDENNDDLADHRIILLNLMSIHYFTNGHRCFRTREVLRIFMTLIFSACRGGGGAERKKQLH